MKRCIVFAALIGGFLITPGFEALAACQRPSDLPAPKVKVKLVRKEPAFHHDKSISTLTKFSNKGTEDIYTSTHRTLGVTVTRPDATGKMQYLTSGNKKCAFLTEYEITATFTSFHVYVAKEYKHGGCAYNAVLKHENQHVAIEKQQMETFVKRLRSSLQEVEPKLKNISASSGKGLDAAVSKLLSPIFKKEATAYRARSAKENGKIDTSYSYAAVHASCPAMEWQPKR
jgi:hypothetical protein